MEDLTRMLAGSTPLTPSPAQLGNTVASQPGAAMTAAGSAGAFAPDRQLAVVDTAADDAGPQIPVSHPGLQPRARVQPAPDGYTNWADAG